MKIMRPTELTVAQLDFAKREGATPGTPGERTGIFFYREERRVAYRWLVDRDGHVADTARFSKAA